jgi:hypothetical protein
MAAELKKGRWYACYHRTGLKGRCGNTSVVGGMAHEKRRLANARPEPDFR